MAWIETETGVIVNLDNVEYLSAGEESGFVEMYAHGIVRTHLICSTEIPKNGYTAVRNRYDIVVRQLAQIARGNAYISQDDIRGMIKKADGQT